MLKRIIELHNRHSVLINGFFIIVVTFLVYYPALSNGFVGWWDDNKYVLNNEHIKKLDLPFLYWAFTSEYFSNWHPLTLISYAIDYQIWTLDPFGYHFINNIFHSLNTLLVFILSLSLVQARKNFNSITLKELYFGLIAALFFGLHPVHVESVAWVSERKDLLCAFFYLLTLIAYLKFCKTKRLIFYSLSIIFSVLALLSKPMAVSIPFALLIMDFYPLERIPGAFKEIKKVVLEKIPFFFLVFISSILTLWAQGKGDAVASIKTLTIIERLNTAIKGYIFYLQKIIFPFDLSPYYPLTREFRELNLHLAVALFIFLLITAFCLIMAKRKKIFLAVWLYYIVTLIPVIGIVQSGSQAVADRYTYLPSLSLFFLVGIGFASYLEQRKTAAISIAFFSAIILYFSFLTYKQVPVWKNPITIWSKAIEAFPEKHPMPYYNRGVAYREAGDYNAAISDLNKVIGFGIAHSPTHYNLGIIYSELGKYEQAIIYYNKALELEPQQYEYYYNRGLAFSVLGDYDKAREDLTKYISAFPTDKNGYINRAVAYIRLKDQNSAIFDLKRALAIDPNDQIANSNLRAIYSKMP